MVDLRNSLLYTAQGAGALTAAILITMNNTSRSRGLRLLLGETAFIFGMLAIRFTRSVWPAMIVIALMGWGAVTQLPARIRYFNCRCQIPCEGVSLASILGNTRRNAFRQFAHWVDDPGIQLIHRRNDLRVDFAHYYWGIQVFRPAVRQGPGGGLILD